MEAEVKVWWKSKSMLFSMATGLFGVLVVAMPSLKPANDWLAANLGTVSIVWGVLGSILRMVTKDKIVLVD